MSEKFYRQRCEAKGSISLVWVPETTTLVTVFEENEVVMSCEAVVGFSFTFLHIKLTKMPYSQASTNVVRINIQEKKKEKKNSFTSRRAKNMGS
jgi:hypothetical protein